MRPRPRPSALCPGKELFPAWGMPSPILPEAESPQWCSAAPEPRLAWGSPRTARSKALRVLQAETQRPRHHLGGSTEGPGLDGPNAHSAEETPHRTLLSTMEQS